MSDTNFKYLGSSFYLVRTQAGLKQAIKHETGTFYDAGEQVAIYPKSYPSIVSITREYYRGYHIIVANSLHVKAMKPAIQDS